MQNFWKDVISATQDLWRHSQDYPLLNAYYVKDIIKFLCGELSCDFRVTSWEHGVFYVMNDTADPVEDLLTLFRFIDKRLPAWENHLVIKGYRIYLQRLLDKYLFFTGHRNYLQSLLTRHRRLHENINNGISEERDDEKSYHSDE